MVENSTSKDHISKLKRVRKLSLGHLAVLISTTEWPRERFLTLFNFEIWYFEVQFSTHFLWHGRKIEEKMNMISYIEHALHVIKTRPSECFRITTKHLPWETPAARLARLLHILGALLF